MRTFESYKMSIHYRVKKFQESEIELTGQFLGQGRYAVVSKGVVNFLKLSDSIIPEVRICLYNIVLNTYF